MRVFILSARSSRPNAAASSLAIGGDPPEALAAHFRQLAPRLLALVLVVVEQVVERVGDGVGEAAGGALEGGEEVHIARGWGA